MISKDDIEAMGPESDSEGFVLTKFVPGELEQSIAHSIVQTYGALTEANVQLYWSNRLSDQSYFRVPA